MRIVVLAALVLSLSSLVLAQPKPAEIPGGTTIVHPVDGSIMVWVPPGEFTMGFDDADTKLLTEQLNMPADKIATYEWYPKRKVHIDGFFIDKYEVSNALWNAFVAAKGHKTPEGKPAKKSPTGGPEFDIYPAVNILWEEAQQYCNWSGKALPTEAQWEKAARGTDGRLYPWGNEPLSPERGVFVVIDPKSDRLGRESVMAPIGTKPNGRSPYGALDMAGNVYEWTSQWMEPYENNPHRDKMYSYTGHKYGCLRGGSFYHGPHAYACAKRFGFEAGETYYHVGFRPVWTPPEGWFGTPEFAAAKSKVAEREAQLKALREKAVEVPVGWGG